MGSTIVKTHLAFEKELKTFSHFRLGIGVDSLILNEEREIKGVPSSLDYLFQNLPIAGIMDFDRVAVGHPYLTVHLASGSSGVVIENIKKIERFKNEGLPLVYRLTCMDWVTDRHYHNTDLRLVDKSKQIRLILECT